MTQTNYLVDYLRFGQLGSLHTGMSLQSATDYLGLPEGYQSVDEMIQRLVERSDKLAGSFWFDSLELMFDTTTFDLKSFSLRPYWRDVPGFPDVFGDSFADEMQKLNLNPHRLRLIVREHQFKAYLVKLTVEISTKEPLIVWFPESGVQIAFEEIEGVEKLIYISKSIYDTNPCTRDNCVEFR